MLATRSELNAKTLEAGCWMWLGNYLAKTTSKVSVRHNNSEIEYCLLVYGVVTTRFNRTLKEKKNTHTNQISPRIISTVQKYRKLENDYLLFMEKYHKRYHYLRYRITY